MRTLHTTDDQFDALHQANAKTRSTSKTVIVDRQDLINLLMDHSAMVAALRQAEGEIRP